MKAWATGDCDNGGDEWEQEIRLAEQAVQAINKLNPKPKFFVLCGDLVHAMPGKTRAVAVILSPSRKKKKKRSLLKRHLCSVTAHSFLFTVVARSSNIRKYTLILVLEYGKFNHSNKAEPTVLITCASYLIICASYENGTDSHVSPFFTYRRQTWIAFGSHIHKHNLLLSFPSFLCFYFSCLCSCFFSFKWQANLNWINFFLSLYYLACVLSCFHRVQLFAAL